MRSMHMQETLDLLSDAPPIFGCNSTLTPSSPCIYVMCRYVPIIYSKSDSMCLSMSTTATPVSYGAVRVVSAPVLGS